MKKNLLSPLYFYLNPTGQSLKSNKIYKNKKAAHFLSF